jgi:serine/threonine-protein kinase
MGEVYRARDTRLNRDVAIKVLPEAFASDSERLARFKREAHVLASLNHPHIAAIYGLEESGSASALVLELVEGPTLADRIAQGPIPLDEALPIAKQICEALEAAHERGIIHRDLKPANIKLTPDGAVKVLDFGLAKAVLQDSSNPSQMALTNSPTITSPLAMSGVGVLLGTAAYMSPEQAKGLAVDHRSDIFSFGVVLYEMLVGKPPFRGDTAPEVLASVMVREADLNGLPSTLSLRMRELIDRCLEKNPKRRWQAIGDVRLEIERVASITTLDAPLDLPPTSLKA